MPTKYADLQCPDCMLDHAGACLHTRALMLLAELANDEYRESDPEYRRARLAVSRCNMHLRAVIARIERIARQHEAQRQPAAAMPNDPDLDAIRWVPDDYPPRDPWLDAGW